jgi:hypothetical protein
LEGRNVSRISVVLVAAVGLSACISPAHRKAMDTERLLTASGFQMKLADTPEKLADLEKLPQRRIVPQEHEGRVLYLYPDAKYCQCLYAGSERSYRHYDRLALLKGFEERRRETAEDLADASMNFGAWGPWGPWR